MYFGVYKVFYEKGRCDKWLWGAWKDEVKANEVAVEIQSDDYFVEIIESDEYPKQHLCNY